MANDDTRGKFVWHELATIDPGAAEKYYKAVIGWGAAPFPDSDPEEPYTLWTWGETPQGGLLELPAEARKQGAPSHWLTYVAVADADETAAKAQSLGATVLHGPVTVPGAGRFAVAKDPQGAVFGFIRGEGERPPAREPSAGAFHWHELTTTDPNAAWDFYSALFGWTKAEAMEMDGGEIYQMFGVRGGTMVGGIWRRTDVPPNWLPYVIVEDLDEVVGRTKANGGSVIVGPMEVPGGDRIAVATDPQGAALGVHEQAG